MASNLIPISGVLFLTGYSLLVRLSGEKDASPQNTVETQQKKDTTQKTMLKKKKQNQVQPNVVPSSAVNLSSSSSSGGRVENISEKEKKMIEKMKELYAVGKEEEALAVIKQVHEDFPKSFESYNIYLQFFPSAFDEIKDLLEKLDHLAKTDEEKGLVLVYRLLFVEGKENESFTLANQLAKKFPQNTSILFTKLTIGMQMKKLEPKEISECADKIIASPNSQRFDKVRAYYFKSLSIIAEESNDVKLAFEQKIKLLDKVLKLQPNYILGLFEKCVLYLSLDQINEATDLASKMVKYNKNFPSGYLMYGKIEKMKNNIHKSIEYFKSVLEIDKTNLEAFTELSGIYFKSDREKLKELISEFLSYPNAGEDVHILQVTLLLVESNYKDAGDYAKKRIEQLKKIRDELKLLSAAENIIQNFKNEDSQMTIEKIPKLIHTYEIVVQFSISLPASLKKFPKLSHLLTHQIDDQEFEQAISSIRVKQRSPYSQTEEERKQWSNLIDAIWFSMTLNSSDDVFHIAPLLILSNGVKKIAGPNPKIAYMMCDAQIILLIMGLFQQIGHHAFTMFESLYDEAEKSQQDVYEYIIAKIKQQQRAFLGH